ncbi:hypothetical protein MKX07_002494 [Trichoderma sp. CBMAI-0711]|nr:hypothetical protein MKX07_002494 [Trichoderma sp. CBMAI-0711]
MKHLSHLSSDNPAQDVSQARSDGKLHLLLAASGSVATIKIPNIIQGLSRHPNLSIRLVLTSSAAQFLQGQAAEQPTLEDIRSYPNVDAIYTDESEWVQPANTLAKMVHGMTDSLLSSIILAWDTDGGVDGKKKKILVATAMNTAMYRNPITQRNLQLLNEIMGGPGGWVEELQTISKGLACGDVGQGAMATWQTIVAAIEEKLGLTAGESKDADPGIFSASKGPLPSSSSRDEQLRPTDLYRACFATFSNDAIKGKAQEEEVAEADSLEQLKEAFAQEGVELYTSAVEKLAEAKREMTLEVEDFATFASSMAADIDELYFNLSYPLSKTLCHSKSFSQATIEAHLANAKEELTKAESELGLLHREWLDLIQLQEDLRQELLRMEEGPVANGEATNEDEYYAEMASFKQEIERIVAESNQAIDEIEENYREEAHAQSMRILQAMLVD